jgi:glycerol-3-phosphate dehydrogenase (NAD(P)+)
VAKELPSAVTIASKDLHVAHRVQDLLSTSRFRCYRTDDVAGTTACTCDT